ncbi:hypothetical protein DES36_10598 [Alkalibaculum bacchi]|uniref:ABC-2 family transporter n=1 Tax=Alkalibaculum bacchi TaxID=645887 RepID=A0A366IAF5_9FIRM|nr:hypothetical protein [Alkalibaculum bacchi]RBP66717.1 hypothetical protein DES36_10598 [Alkalibaculum bacchi]
MLGKLLKYEIKATARTLLPLYLILFVVTVVNRFLNPFEILENAQGFNIQILVNVLSVILYFTIAFSVMAATFIIMIQRFYKNFLGDEGYLSFTLPVETWKHVLSKLLTSMMWIILSILAVIASIIIIADIDSLMSGFSTFLEEIGTTFGSGIYIMLPIYMLSGLTLAILVIYNSISIGHHFQNHKVLASFATFGVFYLFTQIVLVIMLMIYVIMNYGSLAAAPINATTVPNAGILLGTVIAILLLMCIGHFISTNYFLKNKLNLE